MGNSHILAERSACGDRVTCSGRHHMALRSECFKMGFVNGGFEGFASFTCGSHGFSV